MADLRVLLDTNILLDVLAQREPFYKHSAGVWAAVESGQVQGLVAAHSITTLHYLITRYTSRPKAVRAISDMLRVFSVAAVDQGVIFQALALGWADLEDAVQACAAAGSGAHYLITRDTAGYPSSPLPALAPQEFLALLAAV